MRAITATMWMRRSPAPLRESGWVVCTKHPFAGPEQLLCYLSRYTHRVAISNHRLVSTDDNGVACRWKDYLIDGLCGGRMIVIEQSGVDYVLSGRA